MAEHRGHADARGNFRNLTGIYKTEKNCGKMNRKQLTILVVLGIVVGGLGLMLSKRDAATWNRNEGGLGQKILGDFPINDVTHIVIKHTNSELNLIKEDIWTVKE